MPGSLVGREQDFCAGRRARTLQTPCFWTGVGLEVTGLMLLLARRPVTLSPKPEAAIRRRLGSRAQSQKFILVTLARHRRAEFNCYRRTRQSATAVCFIRA